MKNKYKIIDNKIKIKVIYNDNQIYIMERSKKK